MVFDERRMKWEKLRAFLIPVELVFFLYIFSQLFQTLFYQQYYFQKIAKDKLLSLPNYTYSRDHQICLTQDYIVNFIGNASFVDLQQKVNNLNMYSNIVLIGLSFLSAIFLGPLSDRFGRKPVMLIVLVGALLDTVLQILVVHFDLKPTYFLALLAIHGVCGGFPLACGCAFAVVTDTTPKRWLGIRMSTLEACIPFAKALAYLGTNNWIHATDCRFFYPSLLNMSTSVFAILFLFLMTESLPTDSLKQIASINHGISKLFTGVKIYFNPFYLGFFNWWRAWAATGVICFGCVCAIGGLEILNFFLHNRPLEWSYDKIGYFGACMSVLMGLVLVCIVPFLISVKFPNPVIGLIGAFCGITANVMTALVKRSWEMYIAGIFFSVQQIAFPVMRLLLQDLVTSEDRGAIFSVSASFQMFASVFATIIFNQVYHPQAVVGGHLISASTVFWIMVAVWGSAVPLLLFLQFIKTKKSEKSEIQPLLQDKEISDSSCSSDTYGIQ